MDMSSKDLMYHANNDYVEFVERLVKKSANNWYTRQYDNY